MAKLTRSRTVLDHLVPYGDNDLPTVLLHNEVHLLSLPRQKWEDMGSPRQVTITIEPGNTLDGRLGG